MKIGLERLINFWVLRIPPIFSILFIIAITSISIYSAKSLQFEYNIEYFFAENDDEVKSYYDYREQFENENNYLLIGIKNNDGVFNASFLHEIDSLTKRLSAKKEVLKLVSPTNSSTYIKVPFLGLSKVKSLHIDSTEQLKMDKQKIFSSNNYVRTLFSEDTLSLQLVVQLKDSLSKKESKILLQEIQTVTNQFDFDEVHFAGRMRTQQYYLSKMNKEMKLFAILAIFLVVLTLIIVFKNFMDVLLALLSLLISMVISFGLISAMGYYIDLMMILLPAVILIIGTSGSIHFLKKYRSNSTENIEKRLEETIIDTGMPLLFNAVTTSAGFLSLMFIPVVPIQRFGFFAASSILITFTVGLLCMSAVIRLFRLKKIVVHKREVLKSNISWMFNKSKKIIAGTLVVVVLMTIASFSMQVNNFFLDDLDKNSSLGEDLTFFETKFSGIRPVEFSIRAKNGAKLNSLESLKQIDSFSTFLEDTYDVGFVVGIHQVVKSINTSFHGGDNDYYRIPDTEKEWKKLNKFISKKRLWNKLVPMVTADFSHIRMSGRVHDLGSNTYREKNKKLVNFVNENMTNFEVEITGSAHLMDKTSSNLAVNILAGILLAILVSTLCIWWLTENLKIALISILPNLIPLIFAGSMMWLFGIPLKIGTAIVFTIIYGLAVDDTLHFVHRYMKFRNENRTNEVALQLTFDHLKSPLLSTTIVLVAGFLVFSLSEFQSIFMIGMLISSSMIVALLVDLYLLPVFLFRWMKK